MTTWPTCPTRWPGWCSDPDRKVRHLLVDGEPVVTDGQLLGVDLAGAHRTLATRARRLWPD